MLSEFNTPTYTMTYNNEGNEVWKYWSHRPPLYEIYGSCTVIQKKKDGFYWHKDRWFTHLYYDRLSPKEEKEMLFNILKAENANV